MTISKAPVTMRAKADCPPHSQTRTGIRDLTIVIDEALDRGGANVIGRKCADRMDFGIDYPRISASCEFDLKVPLSNMKWGYRPDRPV